MENLNTESNRKRFNELNELLKRANINTLGKFDDFLEVAETQEDFEYLFKTQTERAELQIKVFESGKYDSPFKG